ncbi:MAG: heparinase II/III family protein, partial [Caldilineaceae bacterium]|nr:heparinase II/III family protein [Caldilineaceae bacterium]
QTWYNAGVGVIGFVLDDKELIRYALEKEDSGHYYQMQTSITADGMWYEGAMHYQVFVLNALFPFMEAAHHAGLDVYQDSTYKSLFDFMLDYADANLELPTINDGRLVSLTEPDRATYYEVALRRFGDERYAAVLQATDRSDLNSLLYGVGELPSVSMPPWRSRHFSASELVVLRAGKDAGSLQAVLNIMAYQGGHSHPDQLGLIVSGLGQTLIPDAGSIRYRIPAHVDYFKQSVAHNVLVVDGQSQQHSSAPALRAFVNSSSLQAATATTDQAYPGVQLARTLLLTDEYLIDIFGANSETAHTYDWVLHCLGTLSARGLDPQPVSVPPADTNGYEYLDNVRVTGPVEAGRQTFEWQVDPNRHLRLDQFSQTGDRYFFADGLIAADKDDVIADTTVPVLLARRTAADTEYVSIIQPYGETPAVNDIREIPVLDADGQVLTRDDAWGLQIECNGRTDLLMLAHHSDPKQLGGLVMDGRLAWASFDGDDLQALYLAQGTTVAGNGWAIRLDGASSGPDVDEMGVHFEVVDPNRVSLHNSSARAVVVEMDGWLRGAVEVFELDWEGERTTAVQADRAEGGIVRLTMEPQTAYEIRTK